MHQKSFHNIPHNARHDNTQIMWFVVASSAYDQNFSLKTTSNAHNAIDNVRLRILWLFLCNAACVSNVFKIPCWTNAYSYHHQHLCDFLWLSCVLLFYCGYIIKQLPNSFTCAGLRFLHLECCSTSRFGKKELTSAFPFLPFLEILRRPSCRISLSCLWFL